MTTNRVPSSSTAGFFQSLPIIPPQYTSPALDDSPTKGSHSSSDDVVLARILNLYLPREATEQATRPIHHFSRRSLHPTTLSHAVDAETKLPTLHPLTTFGQENKNDPLHTSSGWKALKTIGIEEGVVGRGYDSSTNSWNRRVEQFGLIHIWTASATLTMCPMSMTDGAATLLRRHLDDPDEDQPGRQAVLREAFRRTTSVNPEEAWTSGQWMTERTGGSDVRQTETLAHRLTGEEIALEEKAGRRYDALGMPLGPWRIDGFKWFSSATDSDMTILLAQTTKGLSAFYMPMRRRTSDGAATELNGVRIQRLKDKMGTKAVPTAELELKGARVWLLGKEGQGIKEVAAILNITRIHTAAGSSGLWARGLAICRAYSKVRTVRGRLLSENAQHLSWMAGETVKYWAATHLTFLGVALLGCNETSWDSVVRGTAAEKLIPVERGEREALLRLLTPLMKSQVSMAAVSGLRSSMECLGGVGYCENNEDGGILNIAKLFRDSVVNTIWEGTVSVMAEDVCRVLKDRRLGDGNVMENVYSAWVKRALSGCSPRFKDECAVVEHRLEALVTLVRGVSLDELHWHGRTLLDHLEAITCAVLLLSDAETDGDATASYVASRWIESKALPDSRRSPKTTDWKTESAVDYQIFLGREQPVSQRPMEKL